MNIDDIKSILDAVSKGSVSADAAAEQLKNLSFEDVGYAKIDHGRAARQGFPEVVFGMGKTPAAIIAVFAAQSAASQNSLATRVTRWDRARQARGQSPSRTVSSTQIGKLGSIVVCCGR